MECVFHGLEAFARFAEEMVAVGETSLIEAARVSSHVMHEHVTKVFGDNQKLTDLAPSTQDERTRLGFTANDPLLRDGKLLRDSFERVSIGPVAGVGSDEPVMAYHEFGTPRIPPRPALSIGLREALPELEEITAIAAGVSLGQISLSSGFKELVP